MWIDSHAHLFGRSAGECAVQLSEAIEAGVKAVVSVSTDLTNAITAEQQCSVYASVFGAAGISPFDVESAVPTFENDLLRMLAHPKMIAVGEIGIDETNPSYPPITSQLPVFERQLAIAKETGLPALIHSRGAERAAVALCRKHGIENALFHCFTGSRDALFAVVDNGYHVSLSGILTFKNFEVRTFIRDIPVNRLLFETDCPYLAPVPHRGKPNRPAWVRFVGEEAARLIGIPAEELAQKTEENFYRLFRKAAAIESAFNTSLPFYKS